MLKINEYFYHLQGKDLFVHKNHSHNEVEFIHVISGSGLVIKNGKTYVLQSQYVYAIDARTAHIVYPEPEDCNEYIRNKIVIDADSFTRFCTSLGMEDVLYTLFDSAPVCALDNPEIDKIYKTVSELCGSEKKENIAFAHGYITQLIHWLHQNSRTKSQAQKTDTFQKILNVINEKGGITSLSEISRILYLDKHYLCRLFKKKTGTTLSSYLSDIAFEKSRKLLEGTSYSIDEIAAKCGFSSQASLTRFFKNKCGISPSKYRKSTEHNVNLHF